MTPARKNMFEPPIIKKIEQVNLIGRGCNNFPVAKKWQMVRDAKTKSNKYVICNVSESEPGVFKDRYILENWPEKVIEGVKIAMKAVGALKGFIYLNPLYYQEFQDYLGPMIEAEKANMELYQKPLHDYVGGEETAVLNSLEGGRVEPRLKPPFPTNVGLFGDPTLINNCETFYAVSLIAHGEYKNTRFYCLSGDPVKSDIMSDHGAGDVEFGRDRSRPVPTETNGFVKELPVEITIKKCLQEFGHKPSAKHFYQVGGGASGICYNHRQLNRQFDGLASIVIYGADHHEKDIIMKWLNFFKNESCGQCVPCREGTYRLYNMMKQYYASGDSFRVNPRLDKRDDPRKSTSIFDDLVFSLQNTSFCPLGKVSVNAMLTYWKNVKHIYRLGTYGRDTAHTL